MTMKIFFSLWVVMPFCLTDIYSFEGLYYYQIQGGTVVLPTVRKCLLTHHKAHCCFNVAWACSRLASEC